MNFCWDLLFLEVELSERRQTAVLVVRLTEAAYFTELLHIVVITVARLRVSDAVVVELLVFTALFGVLLSLWETVMLQIVTNKLIRKDSLVTVLARLLIIFGHRAIEIELTILEANASIMLLRRVRLTSYLVRERVLLVASRFEINQ